jgi:hypothetical protein
MPQKKKQVKKKLVKKKMFVLAVVIGLLLLVWISSMSVKNLSLVCTNSGDSITCTWTGCQPSVESELILAKPSYVESVPVNEESGSAIFSPSSLSGIYTALLYCSNGQAITSVSS